jgi:hypothetical protein
MTDNSEKAVEIDDTVEEFDIDAACLELGLPSHAMVWVLDSDEGGWEGLIDVPYATSWEGVVSFMKTLGPDDKANDEGKWFRRHFGDLVAELQGSSMGVYEV